MSPKIEQMAQIYAAKVGRALISKPDYIKEIQSALKAKTGYASAKIGRSEKQWMYYPILLSQAVDSRRQRAFEIALAFHFQVQSGLFPTTPEFYQRFLDVYIAHLKELDCLGLFLDMPELECELIQHYQPSASLIYYKNQEPDRSSPADEKNCFLPLFAGMRLLLVAPFAHFLRQRATAETFGRVWAKTGKPWFQPASVDSIEFPYGYDSSTQETYGDALNLLDSIQNQIVKKDFDVALISAGGLAMPLAGFVKSQGRLGLSLGGHLQILFGVYGTRWIDRKDWQRRYFNEWWTRLPEAYRPAAELLTDDGAYW